MVAIVRAPGSNFSLGETSGLYGQPNYQIALQQHERYCQALEYCGLTLTRLPPDMAHPDSTFVEDTAIITPRCAIMSRPGAASRLGEIEDMRKVLRGFYSQLHEIQPPGTLDGGDICEAGEHFFIGISDRTNQAGAQQLANVLSDYGYTHDFVDIRGLAGLLHLKSGIAYLGENRLMLVDALIDHPAFQGYEVIRVDPQENYAANCVRVNDHVLIASAYPHLSARLEQLGYRLIELDMSEFRKMDGGLSCLSLRIPG
ncbi:MAG: hypothetical protein JXB15_05195 [Anaerolineales bacterium]|nr:hypothetical protein [Anaerolineales bacterium]